MLWRVDSVTDLIKGDSGDISGTYGWTVLKDPASSCLLASKTFNNAG